MLQCRCQLGSFALPQRLWGRDVLRCVDLHCGGEPATVVVDRPVIQQIFVKHGFPEETVRIASRVVDYGDEGEDDAEEEIPPSNYTTVVFYNVGACGDVAAIVFDFADTTAPGSGTGW